MKIFVNSKELETNASTLSQLIQELSLPLTGIAAAINNHLVPRPEWNECLLQTNDSVVIIKATCGG